MSNAESDSAGRIENCNNTNTYIPKKSDDIYDKCIRYAVHRIKGISL